MPNLNIVDMTGKKVGDIELADSVELFRIILRRRVSFPLLRDHMDQNGTVNPLGFMEQSRHLADIMTVYRA